MKKNKKFWKRLYCKLFHSKVSKQTDKIWKCRKCCLAFHKGISDGNTGPM